MGRPPIGDKAMSAAKRERRRRERQPRPARNLARNPLVDLPPLIADYLIWLADGAPDLPRFLEWFDQHVMAIARAIDGEVANPARVIAVWLEEQQLLDLDDDDRALLMTLASHPGLWEGVMRALGWRSALERPT